MNISSSPNVLWSLPSVSLIKSNALSVVSQSVYTPAAGGFLYGAFVTVSCDLYVCLDTLVSGTYGPRFTIPGIPQVVITFRYLQVFVS